MSHANRWGAAPLLLLLGACGQGPAGPASALLVTLDTTRTDALSCYGGIPGLTPQLDGLAAQGVRYTTARTVAPITAPAHASILTGLYPVRHSLRLNASMKLPGAARTLAEAARERGVRTGAFVAAVVLDDEFGLDQGFERYGTVPADPGAPRARSFRRGAEVVDEALGWLDGVGADEPFFLWVHLFDAHYPYQPPPSFRARAGGDEYLGEVAYVDEQVGRLLAGVHERGRDAGLTVVVTADHGEGRGENGEGTHGALVYDATLHVPLIVRYSDGWGAGTSVDDCVSVVDVFPTLLNALGIADIGDIDGESLYRRAPAPDRGVYFESYFGYASYGWSHLAGWADAHGKYLHSSVPALYGLAGPGAPPTRFLLNERELPDALHPAGGSAPPDLAPFTEPVRRLVARGALETVGLGGEGASLAADIEKLGYAGAASGAATFPDPLEASERPSPNERIEVQQDMTRALALVETGHDRKALPIFRSVVNRDSQNPTAWNELGRVLVSTGSTRSAIDAFQHAVALRGDDWVEPWLNIGLCHEALGEEEEAISAWLQAFRHDVGPVELLARLVALLEARDRPEAASRRALLEELRAR